MNSEKIIKKIIKEVEKISINALKDYSDASVRKYSKQIVDLIEKEWNDEN